MLIAFLDEFGHCGPFVSRTDQHYNHSPVFGLGGLILPHDKVRHFATFFFQLKAQMLRNELARSGVHPATWEKKGSELLTRKNIERYPAIRSGIFRILNEITRCRGQIFYYGREKYKQPADSNATGLYTTVLGHSIRQIDSFCSEKRELFMMILDQHSDRKKLLETAAKTMFGNPAPARCLIEPPFQVESHLYQTIQAADWIAALIGRQLAFRAAPQQFADWEWSDKYFGERVKRLTTHSTLWRPQPAQRRLHGI